MKEFAIRLHKGDDLKKKISEACLDSSAIVLCGVGCVYELNLRMAGAKVFFIDKKDYEILSLTGTVSKGKVHVHGSFSDEKGNVIGGHIADGCLINTTCELVLGLLEDYDSVREYDEKTGFDEIVFRRK